MTIVLIVDIFWNLVEITFCGQNRYATSVDFVSHAAPDIKIKYFHIFAGYYTSYSKSLSYRLLIRILQWPQETVVCLVNILKLRLFWGLVSEGSIQYGTWSRLMVIWAKSVSTSTRSRLRRVSSQKALLLGQQEMSGKLCPSEASFWTSYGLFSITFWIWKLRVSGTVVLIMTLV